MLKALLCLLGHQHEDVLENFPVILHQGESDEFDATLRMYRTKCKRCGADKLWIFSGSLLELPWNNGNRWPDWPDNWHTLRPATPDDILVLVKQLHLQQFGETDHPYNMPPERDQNPNLIP